jgi:hypothetical protein
LQFPEFDRLRRESLAASDAKPPGDFTITSMPALILGRQLSAVNTYDTCDLKITFADTGENATWRGQPSVFSGARQLGCNTALVGWYLPYSRELGDALNFCEWHSIPMYEPARDKTFAANLVQQIESLSGLIHLGTLSIKMYEESLQSSLRLATNSAYGFTLLHLSVPHRPGIFLADQNRLTPFAATRIARVHPYLDNLALADRTLGKLRRAMETSGQWDKTWVIVSSDHSWRQSRLFDNRRDFRVPYLIKPPGPATGSRYERPFNTIVTHDLILAILRGELTDQTDTARWLDAHGKPLPPIFGVGKE